MNSKTKDIKWGLKGERGKLNKTIYGPVFSWRLGKSLGIDIISTKTKTCSFDCIYCQLGKFETADVSRRLYIPTSVILKELEGLLPIDVDYLTLSGMGEPTLASNLGEVIREIKKISQIPIAVLTNSSLMSRMDTRDELSLADFVIAKLDAPDENTFKIINRPAESIQFDNILDGLMKFRTEFGGRFALQIMFSEKNAGMSEDIAVVSHKIKPDQIQLNTPLRPCPIKSLNENEMEQIKSCFGGIEVINVYDVFKKEVMAISFDETLRRRPINQNIKRTNQDGSHKGINKGGK